MMSALAAMDKLGMDPTKSTVVVQGFGNVGTWAAKLMAERGTKVLGISDVSGAYWNDNGINIEDAINYKNEHGGRLEGFSHAEKINADEPLTMKVDVPVPAAVEDVITIRNVDKIQAKLIVEGANGSTSYKADNIINEKGIMVVPDILANSGGVTVSCFEWVQNRMGFKWTLDRVNERIL